MSLSAKKTRDVQRAVHLVAGVILLLYVYTPMGDQPIPELMVRVMAFPVLAISGLLQWQWPRVRRLLRQQRSQTRGQPAP